MRKVALIDSGIDSNVTNLKENMIGETNLDGSGVSSMHGTLCASMMKSIAHDIPIYSLKVLNRENRTSYKKLCEALEYLEFTDVEIISMSLSTLSERAEKYLQEICGRLEAKGKVIIASVINQKSVGYPAVLKSVIGVTGLRTMSMNEYWFNHTYIIQCACDMSPVLIPVGKHFEIFAGTSKATAIMAANIYQIVKYGTVSLKEVERILEKQAAKSNWNSMQKCLDSKCPPSFLYRTYNNTGQELKQISEALSDAVGRSITTDEIIKDDNLLRWGIDCNVGGIFLENLEKKFQIKIKAPVQYYRLLSIGAILGLIEEWKDG